MADSQTEKKIIAKAENILLVRESDGAETAFKLWQELDQSLTGKRQMLSKECLDLVLQVEFFMEDHLGFDFEDLQNALNSAKAQFHKK